MANVVVVAMLVTILGAVYQTATARTGRSLPAIALALGAGAIALTATPIVPAATRLVAATEPPPDLPALARWIAVVHVACFVAFLGYVAIQLVLPLRRA